MNKQTYIKLSENIQETLVNSAISLIKQLMFEKHTNKIELSSKSDFVTNNVRITDIVLTRYGEEIIVRYTSNYEVYNIVDFVSMNLRKHNIHFITHLMDNIQYSLT